MTIFSCNSTVEALNQFLRKGNSEIPRGSRVQLAKTLNCHPTYIAQILSGISQLSLEQAMTFALFAHFSEEETDYFLNLLQIERAGTQELRKYYLKKKDFLLNEQGELGKSLSSDRVLDKHKEEFYSQWMYQALFTALQLTNMNSAENLSLYFTIPIKQIEQILMRLKIMGLIDFKNEKWIPLKTFIHFHGDDTDTRRLYHLSWRLKSIEMNFIDRLQVKKQEQFNFTSLLTLDSNTFLGFKDRLVRLISEMREELPQAKPEKLSVLNIDFFNLKNY